MPDTPFRWPGGARCAVSLTFDDGRASQVTTGLPILDRHGIRATFYVSVGAADPFTRDPAPWVGAARRGHEIGNHSLVHPCSGNFHWARGRALEHYTLARMETELRDAGRRIEDAIGRTPTTFAYPCGQTYIGRGATFESYVPLVARLFAAGRGFLWETHAHPDWLEPAHLPAVWCDNLPIDALLPRLDAALADGGWLILAGHDIAPEPGYHNTLTATLDALCAILRAQSDEIWTAPVSEIAKWLGPGR